MFASFRAESSSATVALPRPTSTRARMVRCRRRRLGILRVRRSGGSSVVTVASPGTITASSGWRRAALGGYGCVSPHAGLRLIDPDQDRRRNGLAPRHALLECPTQARIALTPRGFRRGRRRCRFSEPARESPRLSATLPDESPRGGRQSRIGAAAAADGRDHATTAGGAGPPIQIRGSCRQSRCCHEDGWRRLPRRAPHP